MLMPLFTMLENNEIVAKQFHIICPYHTNSCTKHNNKRCILLSESAAQLHSQREAVSPPQCKAQHKLSMTV